MSHINRDLTLGSVRAHVARLATPAAIEQALFATTGLLHAYWMGQVGSLALAAITMGTTLRLVLISPMMGLSAGGMALVAREIGAGQRRAADLACAQSLALVALVVTPLILVGQLFAPTFLGWMGATGEIMDNSLAYLRIILWGLFFMECMPTMNGVIRGAGRPEYTLRITIASRVVFFILEPILALGWGPFPALGVRGVALAEVAAAVTGVLAQAVVLLPHGGCLTIHLRDLRPRWATMRRILRVAVPCSAQRLSPNLANALFMRLVARLGDSVLAGYAIFTQLQTFVQGPNMGLQSAAATMVGQNLGADQPQRAAKAAWLATGIGAVVSLLLYGLASALAPTLLPLLNSDPAAVAAGSEVLRFALVFGVLNGLWAVLGNALAGAGDAAAAMLVSVVGQWAVQLPACWLLSSVAGLGPVGIWLGMILGSGVSAIGMGLRFRGGRWKEMRV